MSDMYHVTRTYPLLLLSITHPALLAHCLLPVQHADYQAAPLSANPHYKEFMQTYFPTGEASGRGALPACLYVALHWALQVLILNVEQVPVTSAQPLA
jgi:hypothetical protein